jgi:hypothetical protein
MKLNHLNLTVTDPVKTQEFLVKYFALKPRGKGDDNMAFLSDDNGIVLPLMNPKVGRKSDVIGLRLCHENEARCKTPLRAFEVPTRS